MPPLHDHASDRHGGGPLSILIRNRLGDLTPTERRAAHVLLSNYPFAGLETVAQYAARAGISAPSVLRFVARFGFESYPEFQRTLRNELEAQLTSPLSRAESLRTDVSYSAFAEAAVDNVRRTFDAIAPSEFEAILAILGDTKRRIHVVGGRFTEALALYLVRHMRIVRPDVAVVDGQPATWQDQVIDFGKKDVLIVYDIRRYQEDVIHFAEEAQERGATILLFTDSWLSPISQIARHVIAAQTGVPSHWDSSAALFAVTEALVAAVTKMLWETAEMRMKSLEELRQRDR